MKSTREKLNALFEKHGYTDYRWIKAEDIVVAQWVRMKCMFGCGEYGRNATCPPNIPSVSECQQFFDEYNTAVIFRFEKTVEQPDDRYAWTKQINQALLKLEREVFLSGHHKAFLLYMDTCYICADCAGTREACKSPRSARPTPEAMAVDVFTTVRQYGYPIEVLTDHAQPMNRYAFLLVE